MEVLVAGQGVHQLGGTSPSEVEDGRHEVGDARLQQEQGHPLWDELQRGQVVGLLSRDLLWTTHTISQPVGSVCWSIGQLADWFVLSWFID